MSFLPSWIRVGNYVAKQFVSIFLNSMVTHRVFCYQFPLPRYLDLNNTVRQGRGDMRKKSATILFATIASFLLVVVQLNALHITPDLRSEEGVLSDQRSSARAAVYWLVRTYQNDDGGYASLSTGANDAPSSIAGTLDAVLAIAAAGYSPAAIFAGQEETPVGYLQANGADLLAFASANGGQAGKTILALTASAVDPRDFQGQDYVAVLNGQLEPSGAYSVGDPFKQALAMLGVNAVGEAVPVEAMNWLTGQQAANGSWDDGFGTSDNADATAIAIMALVAAGQTPADPALLKAIEFLAGAQQPGGWEYGPGLGAGANSTALVVQALSALGEDWYSDASPWMKNGLTPLDALLAYQSESGAFQSDFGQGPFDDFYATVQAIPAVSGRPFPLPARYEAVRRGVACLDVLQEDLTGGWPSFANGPIDAAGTSRAIQALVAAGEDPRSPRWTAPGGADAVDALEALTPTYLDNGRGGRVGIVMQGVAAAGSPLTVTDFAGLNLPLLMSGHLSPTGEYDSTAFGIFAHAEAMLGLLAADQAVAPAAIDVLMGAQEGGDWGDSDSNGIALQVMGRLSRGARRGTMAALHASQSADGGWGFNGVSNPTASSEVAQGLVAVGLNPYGPDWSQVREGRLQNAADSVMAQQAENGCWPNAFGPGDDPYSTTDAILLLSGDAGWGFSFANLPVVVYGQ
jgi:hypothetical protein